MVTFGLVLGIVISKVLMIPGWPSNKYGCLRGLCEFSSFSWDDTYGNAELV